jgi:hypothetical protein
VLDIPRTEAVLPPAPRLSCVQPRHHWLENATAVRETELSSESRLEILERVSVSCFRSEDCQMFDVSKHSVSNQGVFLSQMGKKRI